MPLRRLLLWTALAVGGLVLAVALTSAVTELTSQRVGLQAEPLDAGEALAPDPPPAATTPPTETAPPPATAPPAGTTTLEDVDDEGGEDDGSGRGRGRGRGRGGDDD